MKVIKPGIMVYANGMLYMRGWSFDLNGQPFDPVGAALTYVRDRVAAPQGAPTADPTECFSADVERLTQDEIAKCRWREQGPAR